MARPARTHADAPDRPAAYRPQAKDWADFRHAMIAAARSVAADAARVADGDKAAIEALECGCSVLESLGSIIGRVAGSQLKVERLVAEQVDEELARYGIKRGALHAVPD